MKKIILIYSFFLIVIANGIAYCQNDTLTLKKAIEITLENNYSIKIVRNNLQIADNNNSLGKAGFLPTLDLTASQSNSINNSSKEYASGLMQEVNGAKTNSLTASLGLNWTLFDGFNMFINKDKLNELVKLSEFNLRNEIEKNVSDLLDTYYSIIKQNEQINYTKKSLTISEERLRITEEKFKLGNCSKLEVLQAKVDKNADKSELFNQEIALKNLKIKLNEILARDKNIEFQTANSIDLNYDYLYDSLRNSALKNNVDLQLAEQNQKLAEMNIALYRSKYFPQLSAFASYNYTKSNDEGGFTKHNTVDGLYYGLNFSFNLFNGMNHSIDLENAKIEQAKAIETYNLQKSKLESELLSNFNIYKKNIELVKFEEDNLLIAEENLQIANEQLTVGKISHLEFREVQKSYVTAATRVITSKYNSKLSEKDILRISGLIFK